MEILGLRPDLPQDPVGQILTHDGHPNIAVVDLGRDVSEALRQSWSATRPFQSGGAIDSGWLLPLLGAGGATASSLFAGHVFVATANPATLMTVGAGVGSAVMGPTGIIAQAPFVAASSALVPVVAPVMLFVTVASVVTGARLDRVQRAVGALSEGLERVRHLMEADDYARLVSAAEQLDEVGSQFEHGQRFTEGMKIALMLARRDVNRLRRRFGHLVSRQIRSEHDARLAVSDINLFVLSSLTELRADALRLQLTLQDDPPYAERRGAMLRRKVEQCADTFREMLDGNPVRSFRDQLQRELDEPGWFSRWRSRMSSRRNTSQQKRDEPGSFSRTLGWFSRTLGGGSSGAKTIGAVDAILDEHFAPVASRMEQWVHGLESSVAAAREESIVIYRERDGGRALRAHHTADVRLVQAA